MKLAKETVDRRVDLLRKEGIEFVTNEEIKSKRQLAPDNEATLLTVGACKPRDLNIPGRNLNGIYFAMDFLTRNQKDLTVDSGSGVLKNKWGDDVISVKGKNVIVIGGGDTGTDCIGTSLRQYCKSIVNLELFPRPWSQRQPSNPWPHWPKVYRVDYGHAEAASLSGKDPRRFAVLTKRFLHDSSKKSIRAVLVAKAEIDAEGVVHEIPGSEHEIQADAVILALGFVGVEDGVKEGFGVQVDSRGNIAASFGEYATTVPGVFAAGDCRRGQSLVVWGIREGREAAININKILAESAQSSLISA